MGMMYGDGEGTVWDRVGRPRRDCMCYLGPPTTLMPIGMRKSPDVSPRRLSDISPQLRQLKYLVVDESIKEDLKSSRSVEDINSASIEERILRITGYYGYQPWNLSYSAAVTAGVWRRLHSIHYTFSSGSSSSLPSVTSSSSILQSNEKPATDITLTITPVRARLSEDAVDRQVKARPAVIAVQLWCSSIQLVASNYRTHPHAQLYGTQGS
ncbi:hypothetical protein MHYP_G00241460 [Metynnis hypsauchen]